MRSIFKKAEKNKDVGLIAVLTVGLMVVIRSMIISKLGD